MSFYRPCWLTLSISPSADCPAIFVFTGDSGEQFGYKDGFDSAALPPGWHPPYLEPHHTTRLSDGGVDHPRPVIALCPTCHRKVHYGVGGAELNTRLIAQLLIKEPPVVSDNLLRPA